MGDDIYLTIRASGPATEGGRLPLTELARIAGEFQATVERIAAARPAELTATGDVHLFELRSIEKLPASPHRPIAELAREQKVRPVTSLDELALSEPLSDEEFESFLAAARSARGEDPGYP